MSQRLVTITVMESDSARVVERVLSFAWIQNVDVSLATRLLVIPSQEDLRERSRTSAWSFAGGSNEDTDASKSLSVVRIVFKVRATHLGATIKALRSDGIGSEAGTIDVTDVRVSTEALPRVRQKRARGGWFRSFSDRLSTLEIHETIASASHLNADHVASVLVASFVAAIGLLTNGTTVVLAAFFISPLMAMVVGATWGAAVGDSAMVQRSLRNIASDAALSVAVGVIVAMILGLSLPHQPDGVTAPVHSGSHGAWNTVSISTDEILSRGPPRSNLVFAALVAAFSGVAVALGHTGGLPSALAGVALSTSLLPPLVNAGLMLGLSIFYPEVVNSRGDSLLTVAAYSGLIYGVNVCFIAIFAYITLRLKRVGGRTLRAAKRDFAVSRQATYAWQHGDNLSHTISPDNQQAESKNSDSLHNDHSTQATTLIQPLLSNQGGQHPSGLGPPPITWQSPPALSSAAARRRRILSPDDISSPPNSPPRLTYDSHTSSSMLPEEEEEEKFSNGSDDVVSPVRSAASLALTTPSIGTGLDTFSHANVS